MLMLLAGAGAAAGACGAYGSQRVSWNIGPKTPRIQHLRAMAPKVRLLRVCL